MHAFLFRLATLCVILVLQAVRAEPGFSEAKGGMAPEGGASYVQTPPRFTWPRVAAATRYKLVASRYDRASGTYRTQYKMWVPQPASGNPQLRPAGDVLPAGRYRWTARAFQGTTPLGAVEETFRITSPKYLMIDLSGGPTATRYPVTFANDVPFGGWTDLHRTTVLVLRRIPAGTFVMGSLAGELGREADESAHTVTISNPFYIGVFEVTQRQWELVKGGQGSLFSNVLYTATRPVDAYSYTSVRENFFNLGDDTVGWPGISGPYFNSFVGRIRAKTGLMLDLPTEAQWEYACRAGRTSSLNNGQNITSMWGVCPYLSGLGRYWLNGGMTYDYTVDTSAGTARVGSYSPNAWGLFDMHGNVAEWCLDWYGAYGGAAADPKGPSSGTERVLRGGSWYYYPGSCRSANRMKEDYASGTGSTGFRLVRRVP